MNWLDSYKIFEAKSKTDNNKLLDLLNHVMTNQDDKLKNISGFISYLKGGLVPWFFITQLHEFTKSKGLKFEKIGDDIEHTGISMGIDLLEKNSASNLVSNYYSSTFRDSKEFAEIMGFNVSNLSGILDISVRAPGYTPRTDEPRVYYRNDYKEDVLFTIGWQSNTIKKITKSELLKNYDKSSEWKFKESFLQECLDYMCDIQIKCIQAWLRCIMNYIEQLKTKITPASRKSEIDSAIMYANKWSAKVNKIYPESLKSAIVKLGKTTTDLAFIKTNFPEMWKILKETRPEVDRWKTDLEADMGDLGF